MVKLGPLDSWECSGTAESELAESPGEDEDETGCSWSRANDTTSAFPSAKYLDGAQPLGIALGLPGPEQVTPGAQPKKQQSQSLLLELGLLGLRNSLPRQAVTDVGLNSRGAC